VLTSSGQQPWRGRGRRALRLAVALIAAIWLAASHDGPIRAGGGQESFAIQLARLRTLIDAGRYREAEPMAASLVSAADARQADSLEVAEAIDALLDLRVRDDRARLPDTIACGRRAVAIKEARLGPDHPGVAATLTSLSIVYRVTGNAAEAKPALERALAIRERAFGLSSVEAGRTLAELGATHLFLNDNAAARTALERAMAIFDRTPDPGGRGESQALYRLGFLALQDLASDAAQRWFERAVAADDRTLPPGHPDRARALQGLATALDYQDDVRAAAAQYGRAVSLLESALGPDHSLLIAPLSDLCRMRGTLGDYAAAIRACDRAVTIATQAFGPEHLRTVTAIEANSGLRLLLGDSAGAASRLEQVLAILDRQPAANQFRIAQYLVNLSLARERQGDVPAALALTTRALATFETAKPGDPSGLVRTQTNHARYLARLGRTQEALALLARARAAAEPFGPAILVPVMKTQAVVWQWQGDAARSLPEYRETIRLWESLSGPDDIRVLEPKVSYATALAQTGDLAGARRELQAVEARGLTNVRLAARALEERQALQYARQLSSARALALTLLASERRPSAASIAATYDPIVRGRALVLDEMAKRRRAVAHAEEDASVQQKWQALTRARERLARFVVRGADGVPAERRRAIVEEARAQRDRAERALADASTAFRRDQAQDRAGLAEVIASLAALPSRSALIAFVRYTPAPLKAGPFDPHPDDAYAAFVMRPRAAVSFTPLGSAREIDVLVTRWRASIDAALTSGGLAPQRVEADYREAGAALRARVWDPLTSAIGPASTAFIVPDGALHLVDLQVLPTGATAFLAEQGPTIHYLLAERDLLLPDLPRRNQNLLAFGAPDFDRSEPLPTAAVARAQRPAARQATAPPGASSSNAPRGAAAGGAGPDGASPNGGDPSDGSPNGRSPRGGGPSGGSPHDGRPNGASPSDGSPHGGSPNGASPSGGSPRGGSPNDGSSNSDSRSGGSAGRAGPGGGFGGGGGAPIALRQPRASRSACDLLAGGPFAPLDGAREETQRIVELWGEMHPRAAKQKLAQPTAFPGGTAAVMLVDEAASERAFKTLSPGRGILHIATHGFFLDGSCHGATAAAAAPADAPVFDLAEESPLLRSGLVFAGANHRAAADVNDDDGMLTAEEIAGLDLAAAEWAVLSACDTGRGDWQAGEGVMGLRRAFQIAGARTVIMSLWSVDDAVSARWMTALYEGRFLRRASTAAAVRAAHRALLDERRARGLSTHPIYWAGFIASGDWR
jgi:tetratricopeptide (TPR) repeat protein